jgi:phosphomannomutase
MALMVGVSGVRGLVGETLTPALVLEFAQACGTLLEGGRVVLGRDSRPSGAMYAAAAAAGLMAAGCEVTDVGIAMTPTVGYEIRRGKYAGGLLITASHNPEPWNGIKTLDDLGLAPDVARAAKLSQIRESGAYKLIKKGFKPLHVDADAGERHIDAVLAAVEADLTPLRGLKVVLDCVNGAGGLDTPRLLSHLGCDLTLLNGEPTGHFAHTPEPIAENLTQLCDAVRETGSAVGFAQDPDADRLALVDETGRFIGEEYTLALATQFVMMKRPGPVAANLSTSRMVDDIARQHGQTVVRTPVGEAHVARAMLKEKAVIGGEGNGGVIDPRLSMVRDSAAAISLVLQLMATTGKPLSQLVAGLPKYVMIKKKAECAAAKIRAAIDAVAAKFEGAAGAQVNRADGIRIDLASGWVHLRASNTEPIFRVIAEAGEAKTAEKLVNDVLAAAGL